MGALISKKSKVNSRRSPQTNLNSYEAACRLDPDLQSFNSTLRDCTSRALNSPAAGVEDCSLSLDSVIEVSQEVLEGILECEDDIWKNKELVDLVKDYFESTLQTLNFCNALVECLDRGGGHGQLFIQNALQQFVEERKKNGGGGIDKKLYSRTLKEFKKFKMGADPLLGLLLLFQPVYNKQVLMLQKFKKKKIKLCKKLKSMKFWRRVSMIIFAATFASVLICSVVVVAVAAPPVMTALAAAMTVPLGSMGGWLNSIWKKYESEVKGQRNFVNSMQTETYIAIKDLDSIRILVDKLEIKIKDLLKNDEFAMIEEEEVVAIDKIRKKSEGFMQTIEDLGERTNKCSRDIRNARTIILEKIEKYPNT